MLQIGEKSVNLTDQREKIACLVDSFLNIMFTLAYGEEMIAVTGDVCVLVY